MKLSPEELFPERSDDRYHRQSLLPWWRQDRVRDARVLVIGAGALGNEVLKLLALTGIGSIVVFDPDVIEKSNLSRTVLFRAQDEGRAKASVAAERASELNPDIRIVAFDHNILSHCGLGVFHWADVIIGAVDNREARVFINSAAARTNKVWVDGAIEGFSGIVRAFNPSETACYECTMNATDRKILSERRSCAMLARDIVSRGHVPTTAVSASIIAAMQVQEAIKALHEQPVLLGEGIHIDGLWNESSRVAYPRKPDCPGHDTYDDFVTTGKSVADTQIAETLTHARQDLGSDAVLDLSRDFITGLECPSCGDTTPTTGALGTLRERDATCPKCGAHRVVHFISSIDSHSPIDATQTWAAFGLPPADIVVGRVGISDTRSYIFDGDLRSLGRARSSTPPEKDTSA